MVDSPLEQELISRIQSMSVDQQRKLLSFAQQIQQELPPGIPGEVLIERARQIDMPKEDLLEMAKAIEEDCGRIDIDGWKSDTPRYEYSHCYPQSRITCV